MNARLLFSSRRLCVTQDEGEVVDNGSVVGLELGGAAACAGPGIRVP